MSDPQNSAILDLSYRNYDGPIGAATMRWAVIARMMILKAFRLKSYWVMSVLSGWYFLAMIIILFFMQEVGAGNQAIHDALQNLISSIVWKDQFFHGFGFSQHIQLVVALMVGAGAIANDNRANALLVYLSKPTRKIDYLIGKWIGVFIPILIVISLPTIFFYLYGLFSFREQGFFANNHWLLPKEVLILCGAAAIHTSLVLFVSSMFKQGTVAGAVYAGVYFMGYFFSLLMGIIFRINDGQVPWLVTDLNFASIDSLIIGFGRSVLTPGGSRPFGMPGGIHNPLPNPPVLPYLAVIVVLVAVLNWITWTRIRAVEIV